MVSKAVGTCFIDPQANKIILYLGENRFIIKPEHMITEDQKIICTLYTDSLDVDKDIKAFVKTMKDLSPFIFVKPTASGLRDVRKKVTLVAYTFFGYTAIFKREQLNESLSAYASKMKKTSKKLYDKLFFYLRRIILNSSLPSQLDPEDPLAS